MEKVKTATFTIESYKDSDGYFGLCSDLFGNKNNDSNEDEEPNSNEICRKWFEYGEYGKFELIIDENMNIVGGKVIKTGKK